MHIGIISGSGFYNFPELENKETSIQKTPFGTAAIIKGTLGKHTLSFIVRHGKNHELLPHMVNYRANISALKTLNVDLLIATSVMGILDVSIPLGELLFFDDLYFPDNRLPSGEICTLFTELGAKERGHYIFSSPFSTQATLSAETIASTESIPFARGLTHVHANGPRFNSRSEITAFVAAGGSTISQTVGPEIVLAGEAEIPFLLLGFGIDYANGIKDIPTPIEALNSNLEKSATIFKKVITILLHGLKEKEEELFNGFIYRFDA